MGSRRTATRVTFGAISLSNCSHFAASEYSNETKPVALPPGRDMLLMTPEPTGSTTLTNTIGTVSVACFNPVTAGSRGRQDDVRMKCDQFRGMAAKALRIACRPPYLDFDVTAVLPTGDAHRLGEGREPVLTFLGLRRRVHQHADEARPAAFGAGDEWPGDRDAATEKSDELPPPHASPGDECKYSLAFPGACGHGCRSPGNTIAPTTGSYAGSESR